MDSLVGKLKNFVPIDKRFGYVDDVVRHTMNQVLREFETITTTRFCSFYFKDFGKHHDRGIGKDQIEIHNYAKISIAQ